MNSIEAATDLPTPQVRMRRPLVIMIVGMAGILTVGVLVALFASRQREATYPANSPQGTVATYLHFLQRGQVDEAYALTSMDVNPAFGPPMSPEMFHQQFDSWGRRSHRVTLVRASTRGRRASVTVDISSFSGGPFGASDETHEQTFTLARRGNGWRITGPPYLYP